MDSAEIRPSVFRCESCQGDFPEKDMYRVFGWLKTHKYAMFNQCKCCRMDWYFGTLAYQNVLMTYKINAGDCPDWLLEIEIIKAKTRFLLRGGKSPYITYKPGKMITKVTNSAELREALNENLEAIITKKRKLIVAKEINNTLGKIQADVKMELMQNAITGNREIISWFTPDKQKQIGEQYGVVPRLKQAQ